MLFLLSNESIRQMRREEQGEGGERAKGNLTPVDLATSDPTRVSLLTTTYLLMVMFYLYQSMSKCKVIVYLPYSRIDLNGTHPPTPFPVLSDKGELEGSVVLARSGYSKVVPVCDSDHPSARTRFPTPTPTAASRPNLHTGTRQRQ